MNRKFDVGDVVMTKWDDSDRPLKATVLCSWRGHRGMKYQVEMEDHTTEIISEGQIVRKVVRRG